MVAVAVVLVACSSAPSDSGGADDPAVAPIEEGIEVASPAFGDRSAVPARFTCEGGDVSPPLRWERVPDGVVELALVVDDPDAPSGTYVHWVLFGLDPSVAALDEGEVPAGAWPARNSGGEAGYTGPCPPPADDAHRYRFTVYAGWPGGHLHVNHVRAPGAGRQRSGIGPVSAQVCWTPR